MYSMDDSSSRTTSFVKGSSSSLSSSSSSSSSSLTLLRELKHHTESVNIVRFTIDGNYCMSGSNDRTVQLWNPHRDDPSKPTSQALHIKSYSGNHGYPIHDIAIPKDNSKFISAGGDKACFVVDVATGRMIRRIQAHEQAINAVDLNNDGTVLMTCSYDQTMCVWDLRSIGRDPIQRMTEFRDSVTCVTHSDYSIIAGCVDGNLRIYDLRYGVLHSDYLKDPITSVSLSNDLKRVVASCIGGTVRLMDIHKGIQLQAYTGHQHRTFKVQSCIASNDVSVFSGSEDGFLYGWDLVSAQVQSRTSAHRTSVSSICAHPTQPVVLSACMDGSMKCWSQSSS